MVINMTRRCRSYMKVMQLLDVETPSGSVSLRPDDLSSKYVVKSLSDIITDGQSRMIIAREGTNRQERRRQVVIHL